MLLMHEYNTFKYLNYYLYVNINFQRCKIPKCINTMQYIKHNSRILYYDNDKKTAANNDL